MHYSSCLIFAEIFGMKYLLPLLLVFCTPAFAARVDTILVHSTAMNKDIKCVVIQPSHPARSAL